MTTIPELAAVEFVGSAAEIGWTFGYDRDTPTRMLERVAAAIGRPLAAHERDALERGYDAGAADRAGFERDMAARSNEPVDMSAVPF